MFDTREIPSLQILIRPARREDGLAAYKVLLESFAHLEVELGIRKIAFIPSQTAMEIEYAQHQPLDEFLTEHAESFWIAEQAGELVGYARATNSGGLRELTDFFLLPEAQAQGIGKTLLERVFPRAGASHRLIVSTNNLSAQVLYMKAGVYPRCAIYSFIKNPVERHYPSNLTVTPMSANPKTLAEIAGIDAAVLGVVRDDEHRWLLKHRQGFLYSRHGQALAYGYVGQQAGPFAVLDSADYPKILAHAENFSAQQGYKSFNINVPSINKAAIDYALQHEFQLDPHYSLLMTDKLFGKFEQYAFMTPMFFI
jgi:ribosomal protein S18 acetylase RimI-like enzyme